MRCVSVIDGALKCLERMPIVNPSDEICIKYSDVSSPDRGALLSPHKTASVGEG